MPEFVDPSDLDEILRSKEKIARDKLGATPNEVAAGLAEPTDIVPDPERPSTIDKQARQNA